MTVPTHIKWFVEEQGIQLKNNIPINCYLIDYRDDDTVLDEWALHIRRNYIDDMQLLEDAEINEMSVEEYLSKRVIPQKKDYFGPTSRSADIGEIIVSDLLEFVYGFSVPRYKMKNRSGKCNSQQGTDVIGYKYYHADHSKSDKDELIATEVKATLTLEDYSSISKAIKDSAKDEHRLARSIDYCRKRLRELGQTQESKEITRFLFKPDMDYKLIFAAAGISSKKDVDSEIELDAKDDGLEIRNLVKCFFMETHTIRKCKNDFSTICDLWVEGKTPFEMNTITANDMNDIDDVCSKQISYELSFFIGNIRDLLADSTGLFKDELEEQLSLMQKKVKYGVPTLTALSICEKVFYDRLLAVRITYLLGDSDISEDEIVTRLKQRREDVELLLNDYPEFFWKRIISVLY